VVWRRVVVWREREVVGRRERAGVWREEVWRERVD
jgi:hypothetical protein